MKKVLLVGFTGWFIAVLSCCTTFAQPYTYRNYASTEFISVDQMNQIVSTLQAHMGEDTSCGRTSLNDTGLQFESLEDDFHCPRCGVDKSHFGKA